ncbi:flavodoxin family protein [Thermanaeromonas sp. C210]|uniref:flavodoxin family protein n=1 Tax=Thermanaeromonas sp. C210 TaxID=2731925 RepID=UPI00155CA8FE|nr:flavodoxin family protein [Thermanaeromonas sp. C210]GFN24266.1 NAD(FAD)-dependent dehydrogenase [Thermanaeromonas sp. C210]
MIKVLGICGSPRKGNSQYLLEKALEAAQQVAPGEVATELYSIRGKKFAPCIGCSRCGEKQGECIFQDDFQELREKWLEADAIIYSVPVYHMGIPAQLKAFIDRLGNSLFGRYAGLFEGEATLPKSMKVVGAIAQGCHLFSGQEHTITDLINHALVMGCVPVTGDMWEAYIGAAAWTYNEGGRNVLESKENAGSLDMRVALRGAATIGRRAAELAMIIKAGGQALSERLKQDPIYRPFLDRLQG